MPFKRLKKIIGKAQDKASDVQKGLEGINSNTK